MTFSDLQVRRLKAKLDAKRVKSRQHEGRELAYVEGWYVMTEANRIFGFDGWDRLSLSQQLLYEKREFNTTDVAYIARVRVIVRAGSHTIVREGSGFGSAKAADHGEAHELALKAAETDATKRALATFGNRFGLALYDKEQTGVAKPSARSRRANEAITPPDSPRQTSEQTPPTTSEADDQTLENAQSALVFLKALRERVRRAVSIAELDDIVARTADELAHLRDAHPDLRDRRGHHLVQVVASVIALRREDIARGAISPSKRFPALRVPIDKSRLALAVAKRHRDKDHLKYVATHPCLICGRSPVHAHHVRYAQPRGLGLKVSDEFTVPLCAIDHDALHRSGHERRWWREKNIDPLPHAERLWAQSRRASVSGMHVGNGVDNSEGNAHDSDR